MTNVQKYSAAFLTDDAALEPGDIFRKLNGTLWYVDTNGDQQSLTSGGASPVLLTSKTLSAADILALSDTPIEILPAPGGRMYYVPFSAIFHYRFGTTPYTGASFLITGYGSTIGGLNGNLGALYDGISSADVVDGQLLTQTQDTYVFATFNGFVNQSYTAWFASSIENQPFSIANTEAAVTDGDGTLTFRLFYALIDGA